VDGINQGVASTRYTVSPHAVRPSGSWFADSNPVKEWFITSNTYGVGAHTVQVRITNWPVFNAFDFATPVPAGIIQYGNNFSGEVTIEEETTV